MYLQLQAVSRILTGQACRAQILVEMGGCEKRRFNFLLYLIISVWEGGKTIVGQMLKLVLETRIPHKLSGIT